MVKIYDNQSTEAVRQNLRDAGCDGETIEKFLACLNGNKLCDGMKLLDAHRRALLGDIHKDEKRIDCLDYLVYRLSHEKNERKTPNE